MTIELSRRFNARIVPTCAALALIAIGAVLRLSHLDAMEFKRDEAQALSLAIQLLADRPWATLRGWPTHGMPSSNGIANAPLFTWMVAAIWAPAHDPIPVARVVALVNIVCLYPLWRWARRRMSERAALLTLAISAVSPFAVMFSRKIWTQDLLLPGVLAMLWGVEWLRGGRPWRGLVLLALAVLLVGQLHQSGVIGVVLLPLAIGIQLVVDRRRGSIVRLGKPTAGQVCALAILLGLNLFFWLPYLWYLAHSPSGWLANRPKLGAATPDLLLKIEAQIVPIDVLSFFEPHRGDFLRDAVRAVSYQTALLLGLPLLVFGLWRWLRAPLSVPVFGIWWWFVIAAFTLARIPTYESYVMTLSPLTAILAAGAFDPQIHRTWVSRALLAWRGAYVAALLALTIGTQAWVAERGGAAGDYGVAYRHRKAQADAIVRGAFSSDKESPELACNPLPEEVAWLVGWLDRPLKEPIVMSVCDTWVDRGGALEYDWIVRQ